MSDKQVIEEAEAVALANAHYGKKMVKKWEEALNAFGGISSQYMAEQTAILLENYLVHLKDNAKVLLTEDEISSGNFQGVNLALLSLIRRAIPSITGLELVGMQAMPTPESPIFFLIWQKALASVKGQSQNGQDLFGYPGSGLSGSSLPISQVDPYFSSSQVRDADFNAPYVTGAQTYTIPAEWKPVISSTLYIYALDAQGNVIDAMNFVGAYVTGGTVNGGVVSALRKETIFTSAVFNVNAGTVAITYAPANAPAAEALGYAKTSVNWEFIQESNPNKSEITAKVERKNITLIQRDLRGKYTFEGMTDARVLHGLDLESELLNVMKIELTNEINREIVTDLFNLAAIRHTIDYAEFTANNTVGNYDDTAKLILDTIGVIASEVYNQTRIGRANWVLANPVTLSFLDRVPGFVGSGVDYDGKALSFKGRVGRLAFYEDPQVAKNRLLIGYKGNSALDTGYIYAPYTPITAMPTLYDPETSDMRKIFKTRYGKTFNLNRSTGLVENVIYRGEWFYAVLTLKNFPFQDIVA